MHITLSDKIVEAVSVKVDSYVKNLSMGNIVPGVNLETIKNNFIPLAIKEIENTYKIRNKLARKHAIQLLDDVVAYRISLCN